MQYEKIHVYHMVYTSSLGKTGINFIGIENKFGYLQTQTNKQIFKRPYSLGRLGGSVN